MGGNRAARNSKEQAREPRGPLPEGHGALSFSLSGYPERKAVPFYSSNKTWISYATPCRISRFLILGASLPKAALMSSSMNWPINTFPYRKGNLSEAECACDCRTGELESQTTALRRKGEAGESTNRPKMEEYHVAR